MESENLSHTHTHTHSKEADTLTHTHTLTHTQMDRDSIPRCRQVVKKLSRKEWTKVYDCVSLVITEHMESLSLQVFFSLFFCFFFSFLTWKAMQNRPRSTSASLSSSLNTWSPYRCRFFSFFFLLFFLFFFFEGDAEWTQFCDCVSLVITPYMESLLLQVFLFVAKRNCILFFFFPFWNQHRMEQGMQASLESSKGNYIFSFFLFFECDAEWTEVFDCASLSSWLYIWKPIL